MPASGVSIGPVRAGSSSSPSVLSRPVVPAQRAVVPLFEVERVDFQALFLESSPRAAIRVDTPSRAGGWLHAYRERPLPAAAPRGPYAVYLADERGRFRRLCFDLDSKRGDTRADLARLRRALEEAGLGYVVAASGSAGGRHVWVSAQAPLEAALVGAIAEAAAARLSTLDAGMLRNPRTGAARPIGAPHRDGGRSRLLAPADPARAAAALDPGTCGNPGEAFVRLLAVLDALPAADGVRARVRAGAAPGVEVVRDRLGPRLPGTPDTALDAETYRLLTRRPEANGVSEALASLLTRLALRRWTWPMVERLLDDRRHREGGLLHACSSAGRGTVRVVLPASRAREKLQRQWSRCVAYAATLPLTEDSARWGERFGAAVALVERVQAAADACPGRWAVQAGPADRAALDLLCLLALRAGTTVLDLDVRRAALATGHGRSTMHRALARLAAEGWLDRREGDGGPAGTHELLDVTAGHPAFRLGARLGHKEPRPPVGERGSVLDSRLSGRLAAGQADVFAYGRATAAHAGGLGHHAGRVYQQLAERVERPGSLAEVCAGTGYAPRTAARHLSALRDLMVVTRAVMTVHHECPACAAVPGERCRTAGGAVLRRRAADQHEARRAAAAGRAGAAYYRARPGSLVAAAKVLGTHGRLAARARRYAVEQEVYRWWCAEVAWMRAPRPAKPARGRGCGRGVVPYPRTAAGRGDHHAALAVVST